MSWPVLLSSVMLFFCGAPSVPAAVTNYPIVQDTRIDSRDTTTSYGSESSLKLIKNSLSHSSGSVTRMLVALPQLPTLPAADVYSARVWLCETWYSGPPNEGPYTRGVTLYPLTQAFNANTVTWQNSGGGQYDSAHPVAWTPAPNIEEQANWHWWCNWDIKPLWNDSNLRNNGAVLMLDPETPPSTSWVTKSFVSSEYPTVEYRPFVEVVQLDEWKGGSGNWTVGTAWTTGTAPNVKDAAAGFLGIATQDVTVTVNSPVTVGTMLFDNAAHKYTLAGSGSNAIAMNDLSGNAAITVNHGSHAISAPLVLTSNVTITVANAGDVLTLSGAVSGDETGLTKNGAGTLLLDSTGGAANDYSGRTTVNGGTVLLGNADSLPVGGDVTINTGATIREDGNLGNAVQVGGLAISGTGKFDLSGGKLIVDGSVTSAAAVRTHIAAARNGGLWNGPGIVSSWAIAAPVTYAVGYMSNSELGSERAFTVGTDPSAPDTWFGRSASMDSIFVRLTYAGDANMSGEVTTDDFDLWKYGYAESLPATWYNGDLDYSGMIDTDDFDLWKYAYSFSYPALEPPTAAAVPEPGTLALLCATAVGCGLAFQLVKRLRHASCLLPIDP